MPREGRLDAHETLAVRQALEHLRGVQDKNADSSTYEANLLRLLAQIREESLAEAKGRKTHRAKKKSRAPRG